MRQAWSKSEQLSHMTWSRSRAIVIGLGLVAVMLLSWPSRAADVNEQEDLTTQRFVRAQQEGLAPDFTLADLEGTSHRLQEFKGQVVLLVFWATW